MTRNIQKLSAASTKYFIKNFILDDTANEWYPSASVTYIGGFKHFSMLLSYGSSTIYLISFSVNQRSVLMQTYLMYSILSLLKQTLNFYLYRSRTYCNEYSNSVIWSSFTQNLTVSYLSQLKLEGKKDFSVLPLKFLSRGTPVLRF